MADSAFNVCVIFVLFTIFHHAQPQITEYNKCPLDWQRLQLQPNFDFNQFMGVWYEIQYHDPRGVQQNRDYWSTVYIYKQKGGIKQANVELRATRAMAEICFIQAGSYMHLESFDSNNPAKLKYTSSRDDVDHMYIVSTDYVTYAIAVLCPWDNLKQDRNCSSGTKISVLGRQPILINEFTVRNIVTKQLCRDYDNGMYDVDHTQDCMVSSGHKVDVTEMLTTLSMLLFVFVITDGSILR